MIKKIHHDDMNVDVDTDARTVTVQLLKRGETIPEWKVLYASLMELFATRDMMSYREPMRATRNEATNDVKFDFINGWSVVIY